jgi:photosystem II stability/assembly factor-like uncharacterized protein
MKHLTITRGLFWIAVAGLSASIFTFAICTSVLHLHASEGSRRDAPQIDAVTPASAANDFDAPVVISGSGFQVVLSGSSVLSAPVVQLGSTLLRLQDEPTSRTLTALVPWGLAPGAYTLTVANADGGVATLPRAFTVTQALGVWATGGPFGGSVSALAVHPQTPTIVYADLDMVGLFKSADSGDHWQNIFPGYVTAFTLMPDHPETIYLSGDLTGTSRLLRSDDGGQNWEIKLNARPWSIGVSPADPGVVYVGCWGVISRSVDGGETWATASAGIPADQRVGALAVHPLTPTIAYAGVDNGQVYSTTDGGAHWFPAGASFGAAWWRALVIDPHMPQRLYASGWHGVEFVSRSVDGGATWQPMVLEPGLTFANDILVHPTLSGTVYAEAFWGLYASDDGGASWNKLKDAPGGWRLALHPQTGAPYAVGHLTEAFYRSDDGGATWQAHDDGLAGIRPRDIAPSPSDPRYIYIETDSGVFISNNGGHSWRGPSLGEVKSGPIAVDPLSSTLVYAGGGQGIYRSEDGGQVWTNIPLPGMNGQNNAQVNALTIDPQNARVVYAGVGEWSMNGGAEHGWIYRSTDRGVTWNPLTVTVPISSVTDIAVDPWDGQVIYASTGRRWEDTHSLGTGIVKSTDGGLTWQYMNQGLTAANISRLAINPGNPAIVYAGSNLADFVPEGGVFRSTDGGQNWTNVGAYLRVSGLGVDPLMTHTVYAGSYWAGLFRSDDDGTNWERVPDPLGHLSSLVLRVTQAQSRTIVYAGVVGGIVTLPLRDRQQDALAAGGQFFGSGVYQLVVDRRVQRHLIFLPVIRR